MYLHSKITFNSYDPGGGSNIFIFIQRVFATFTEDNKLTMAVHMLKTVEEDIPKYKTKEMRRVFQKQINNLHSVNIPEHILRYMYCTLTGDNSAKATSHQIDERISLANETEDPELVTDLCHLKKGHPGDTFTIFFHELEAIMQQLTAADDRCHSIAHMGEFFSVRDLIEKVKARIPEGSPIPSVSIVIHSFAPPNMHARTAQYYTRKINSKFTIQRHQLRAYHSDAHWCNALFRYLQEMAIMYRGECVLLSCDDEAKVDFGEPGAVLSTGVRGKKSLIRTTSILGALDHDVSQKGMRFFVFLFLKHESLKVFINKKSHSVIQ